MRGKSLVVIGLLCLAVALVAGQAVALEVPSYFANEWVAFLCLNATPTGSGPTTILLQFNFDKQVGGGIPLQRADVLFDYLANHLGVFSPVIGSVQGVTCSLSPSAVQAQFGSTATALEAVNQVAGNFQQLGFARYVIADTFLSAAPDYLNFAETVRSDTFRVNGPNNLDYQMTAEILEALLP
jgi:hypothetical protein